MSKRHNHNYYPNVDFPIAYVFIILVLIILQWFRVGSTTSGAPSTAFTDSNLVSNGGLFIITLFVLIACSCGNRRYCEHKSCSRHCRYRC